MEQMTERLLAKIRNKKKKTDANLKEMRASQKKKLSSSLPENTLRLYYKDEMVNTVQGNNRRQQ
jgi:hypothetical protein